MSGKTDLFIGHIHLAKSFNGAGGHFLRLIEDLQREGVQQHVLVCNVELVKQLDMFDHVSVGPAVHSPVSAFALMPPVDVVHAHDAAAGHAGLLLLLTRSIPYVLTLESQERIRNPIMRAISRRAGGIIDQSGGNAARHLRIYRHAVASWHTGTMAS